MPYLIGTDEAGYAPNLGPLVISATLWHVEGHPLEPDLYKRLRKVVCKKPPAARTVARRLAICDSKLLYKPPAGLAALERGVLAALSLLDCCPATWEEIWQLLDIDAALHLNLLPWHLDYRLPLPAEADRDELVRLRTKLVREFNAAGVRLVKIRSTAVFPQRFNDSTHIYGNKGEALSKLTLQLVEKLLPHCCDQPVTVICDKHGGRNHYGRVLQEQFPDPLVEVHFESMRESIYRFGPPERRTEFRFRAGGEAFLPAALASMTSKYLRELAMRAFNDYWCCRVPDLQPTAGYPKDAQRFKQAISAAQSELGIADHVLWRAR